MGDLLWPLAELLQGALPEWVRLPNLTFQMPHWMYWGALALFPLFALAMYYREKLREPDHRPNLPTALLLLVTGGYVGLHRFYLRSFRWGFVFIVLFMLVLFGNGQAETARNEFSKISNDFKSASFEVKHWTGLVNRGRDRFKPRLEAAKKKLATAQQNIDAARLRNEAWPAFTGFFAFIIAGLLIIDLFLLPMLVARARRAEADRPPPEEFEVMARGGGYDPRSQITNPLTRLAGWVNGGVGNFIALWSVLAVFVYYFEVVSRYVFNSPTNWAHESMFIMFGMQYVLAGGYALREEAHVRVDVIYEKLSVRTRAILDVFSAVVFFVFVVVLLITSWTFAIQSMPSDGPWEKSFTEWQLQYWPAKAAIFVGSALIFLQGLAKLSRDLTWIAQGRSPRMTNGGPPAADAAPGDAGGPGAGQGA